MKTYLTALTLTLLAACSSAEPDPTTIVVHRYVVGDDDDSTTHTGDDDVVGDDDDDDTVTDPTGDTGTGTDDTETGSWTGDTGDTGYELTGGTGTEPDPFPAGGVELYIFKDAYIDFDEPLVYADWNEAEILWTVNDELLASCSWCRAELVSGPVTPNDCAALGLTMPVSYGWDEDELDVGTWMCMYTTEGSYVAVAVTMEWFDTKVLRIYK